LQVSVLFNAVGRQERGLIGSAAIVPRTLIGSSALAGTHVEIAASRIAAPPEPAAPVSSCRGAQVGEDHRVGALEKACRTRGVACLSGRSIKVCALK